MMLDMWERDSLPVQPATALDWLVLTLLPEVGARRLYRLREQQPAWPQGWLAALPVAAQPALREYLAHGEQSRAGAQAARLLAWCDQGPHRGVIHPGHPDWPALLDEIADPPPLLWVWGDVGLLSAPALAVVGTRKPTSEGSRNARHFSHALAGRGLCIVSGLALGIDGLAHQAALDAGGETIAVLGCGIDTLYPRQHQVLRDRLLAERGLLISEHPPGVMARPQFFPRRNRIITGLAMGVLVVEAALKSGSLVSARMAVEQNRDVFALPGSLSNPQAAGCLWLIQQGARLTCTPEEIFDELPLTLVDSVESTRAVSAPEEAVGLLALLGEVPVPIDTLIEQTGRAIGEVSSELLMLEIEGRAGQAAGGWVRTL
ncbi:DNA-processing protein DprA [Larsenimonas rhizosphaerae]|uniref:DNA-processing protein DprA n=1 Tax=Larsenimonas rhizosphaerae TaxID=2944682 RepID=UPI00203428D6|nr:DNA-processing protein DprA [Larsenimonas rhizosphaerae]MCM2129884.1 DNA-processing protein DprA [Larsenimonas rhizosphaerae]